MIWSISIIVSEIYGSMKHCDTLQSRSPKGGTRILRLHGKCDGAESNSEGIVGDMECKCYSSFAVIHQHSYSTYGDTER